MSQSIVQPNRAAELQRVSGKGHAAKASLQKVSDTLSTSLISRALMRAGLSQKEAALTMGISESLFARQLKGVEHLSWQRLSLLPDAFWLELLFVVAESRGVARVRRVLEEERIEKLG